MADSDRTKKRPAAGGQSNNTKKKSSASGGKQKKSSSQASKKTGAAAKTAGAMKKTSVGYRLRDEIIAVLLVALGIFLIVSVMTTATGKFGSVLSHVLKGLFGIGAYLLPFYIIVYALLVLMNRMAHINSRSIFFLVLMYIDLVTVNSVRFSAVSTPQFGAQYLKNMYLLGTSHDSAGAIGMGIGWFAVKGIGKVGLVIVCIAILVISLMLLINTPISSFFDRRREKKYQNLLAREAQLEAAEAEAQERREMKEKLKADQAAEEKSSGRGRRKKKASSPEVPEGGKEEDSISVLGGAEEDEFGQLRIKAASLFENDYGQLDLPETPLSDDKRHILEYMKDDNLFDSSDDDYELTDLSEIFGHEEPSADFSVGGVSGGSCAGRSDGAVNAAYGVSSDRWNSDFAEEGSAGSDENLRKREDRDSFGDADLSSKRPEGQMGDGAAAAQAGGKSQKMTKSEANAAIAAGAAEVASQANQVPEKKQYHLPPMSLLNKAKKTENRNERAELAAKAQKLETVLHDFGVSARVIDVKKGPAVTRYEIQPDTGVKVNSIVRLTDDIALNLEAKSLRIEAPIPGKAAVGIEVENDSTSVVTLREMIESNSFQKAESKISFVVGEDIAGNSIVGDLKSMPHLLIAGSTGSGKSVCINSIIMSMLYKSTPDEVKFILIDPKVVELGNYNGIPHMLIPVITDPSKAAAALAWAVQEMNDRYRKFAESSVRDLKSYNAKMKKEEHPESVLPQIVIIIDELADLMMAAPSQVEEAICRLAQLARAAGMHLIVATQRPSVDIVTGLIKANIPSRIAFAVSSQFDSRTILDRAGAEKLVGKGDMLYNPIGKAQPERLQGPFVTDDEVNAVIDFWKAQAEESEAPNRILESINTVKIDVSDEETEDELLNDAIELVVNAEQASASMLQRRFRIGYNRAGRLVDIMEARGIIGPSEGSKPRRVLISKEEYYGVPEENPGDETTAADAQAYPNQMTGEDGES